MSSPARAAIDLVSASIPDLVEAYAGLDELAILVFTEDKLIISLYLKQV